MDAGLRTPLLDSFRRGEATDDLKLLAAAGALPANGLEQLAVLALLLEDADVRVRERAERTLREAPAAILAALLARSDVPGDLRAFYAARGIAAGEDPAPDSVTLPLSDDQGEDFGPEPETEQERLVTVQRVAAMTIPQRVKAAMHGTREMRGVLIRDPNRLVALTVLRSPRLTDTEVESFARMTSVDTDVLRAISQTRAWMKNYAVVLALVRNPKTPLFVSQPLLKRLTDTDVRRLSLDRNVPEVLRIAARKKVVIER
jgi:hypothetical protein